MENTLEGTRFDLPSMVFQKVKEHMFQAQAVWDPTAGHNFLHPMRKQWSAELSSASAFLDNLLNGATFGQARPSRTGPPFCEGEVSVCSDPPPEPQASWVGVLPPKMEKMVFQKVEACKTQLGATWPPSFWQRFLKMLIHKNVRDPALAAEYLDRMLAE